MSHRFKQNLRGLAVIIAVLWLYYGMDWDKVEGADFATGIIGGCIVAWIWRNDDD